MNNFIAKLKHLDYKQVMIEHGEKIVFGFVVLCVLMSLVGTRWVPYGRKPEELVNKVKKEEATLSGSTWPEETRKEILSAPDVGQVVNRLGMRTDVSNYEFRTQFYWPLYAQKEKYNEPKLLPVEELVADAGYVILEFQPEESAAGEAGGLDTGSSSTPEGNQPEFPAAAETAPPGGGPGPAASEVAPKDARGQPVPRSPGTGGVSSQHTASSLKGGAATRVEPTVNARGLRYVAVRGIFPLRKQLDKIAAAMNEPLVANAAQYLDFQDFVLERQTAVSGPDPWSGPWEKVNVQDALDVLYNVVNWDVDLIPSVITDAVFTMPLPERVAGSWGEKVTHPRIKTLTKEEAERQMLINKKMLEMYDQLQQNREQDAKGGFAVWQQDLNKVRHSVDTDMQKILEAVKTDLEKQGNYVPFQRNMSRKLDPEELASKLTPDQVDIGGTVLLFRYLDFNVEPGHAYRYRVRVTVRNPNFGRPIAELVDPSSAEGKFRDTPVSEPSSVASLPEDVEVFLTRVDPPRGSNPPSVDMEVFEWYEPSGTMIRANLKKLRVGDAIGGLTKTEVLRPATQTFEEESGVDVSTNDAVLDIAVRPRFDPTAHPDLQLDPRARTALGLVDQVLVLDRSGQLAALDTASKAAARANAQARLEAQNAPWKFLKDRAVAISSSLDDEAKLGSSEEGMEGIEEMEGMEGMEEADFGAGGEDEGMYGRRRSNPLRRRGRSRNR